VYFLGQSFEGLPLVAKLRRLSKPGRGEAFGADFYSYLYGQCSLNAGEDGGCPAPIEVQSWAACKRNLSVYTLTPDGKPLPRKQFVLRGVPAALFEEGNRLEVYTGTTTIVIFGNDPKQIRRAADQLRTLKGSPPKPGEPLPPPADGALQGTLPCS
jgi:hypothetical protein